MLNNLIGLNDQKIGLDPLDRMIQHRAHLDFSKKMFLKFHNRKYTLIFDIYL